MTRYTISYQNPLTHFVQFEVRIDDLSGKYTDLSLPSWRPGRYQIQNFAKNIKGFKVENTSGEALKFTKTTKDSWRVALNGSNTIVVKYAFFAFAMDAGNSWLDDEQLYLNFVNCCIYAEVKLNAPCEVHLDLPESYRVACGLKKLDEHKLYAPNYYQLVDSPMMASASLRHITYTHSQTNYHIWIQGELPKTDADVISDFEAFTQKEVEIMGELPCEDYHFLFQCLPYKHYHGVEHWNSTVITIGPSEELAERKLYKEFLGVSSHELFHTWNVIRLRPKEMVPYNFQAENYHTTGYITEGITTYYGDLILMRSGVFSFEEYIEELNKLLMRHFENDGRSNYSVAESSWDLWLDGYEKGIPGRKVSIYNEGALAALILDLSIRNKFNNKKSLDDVMRLMWARHGQDMSGYTDADYRAIVEKVYEAPFDQYFDELLFSTADYKEWLTPLFEKFGLRLLELPKDNGIEHNYGFKTQDQFVTAIAAGSHAETVLSLKDKIEQTAETKNGLKLTIDRFGVKKTVTVHQGELFYFLAPELNSLTINQNNPLLKGWLELA
ncbi:M61 family metallopeptidase [Roseivirga pacifica]|uniref:M61 family metallopeptidase n=1 Tax=Roseivirga pacifica TaxID=1267423 RepID=UPI00209440EA|nr:M61 family peptidase [Roseivirga pacifica]MCO6358380.1 M61 family peptidase [Roseivirga pacifica]MCO6366156.1 M61 family peptidase [Roseivirga pacifica]MCO6369293.1 M61 family peptidase [Roseivirga pacifica]MCO6374111.1 M61 family peptidase [Roseivirga pacifica]MCO6378487.1 M61 family peptidase [Roseivirga pacifica]